MSVKKERIYFIMRPLSEGGHSRKKLVVFGTNGDDKPCNIIYAFGGVVKNGVPQLWEKKDNVEKFSFWNVQNEMIWLMDKWQVLSQSPFVDRAYISDSDYWGPGTGNIDQWFRKPKPVSEQKSFLYLLKIQVSKDKYECFYTVGEVNYNTGEVQNDKLACWRDLQAQYNQWRHRYPEKARLVNLAVVLGDGLTYFENPRLAPWLVDFNPQTANFQRKGRREVIKIHSEAVQRRVQDFEELVSNYTA